MSVTLHDVLKDDGLMQVYMGINPRFPKTSSNALVLHIRNPRTQNKFMLELPSKPEPGTVGHLLLERDEMKTIEGVTHE